MKRSLRNLSKGKLAAALVLMCALVFGGYFGYHKFVVHAGSTENKAVVNTLEEYNAMCESGKVNCNQEAGDKDNPFLILEIVPYYGQAEIGYLLTGCEPIDFTKNDPSLYAASVDRTRSVATTVFADEYRRDANGDGQVDETCWDDDEWTNEKSKQITVKGYYEKVGNGKPGDFVIDHYEADTTGMFYAKDENGKDQPAYRPVFRKVEDGTGDFLWVTLANGEGRTISESDFNRYARNENKYQASADGVIEYDPGDREYTTRTDTDYYYIKVGGGGEGGWSGSAFKGHVVNMNDFARTSLDLDDKSEAAILDLKLAVKTIEPQELMKHPEWIDYADLIYIHQGQSIGVYSDWWKNTDYNQYHKIKDESGESFYKDDSSAQSKVTDIKFTSDNDWGWNVAKKMFFKINQLDEYDGSSPEGYGFAPLLFSVTALDNLNGLSKDIYGSTWKDVTHNHLDYTDMEVGGVDYKTGATNSGLYKFMLMNFLMDQENFYDYFFQTRRDNGQPVITEDAAKNVSYCSPQNGADAQEYWSVDAFLPITEKVNDTNISDEQVERYDISHYGGAYLNYPRPSLHGATFIYNSDTLLSQGYNNASIKKTDETQEAFDWFEKEYGKKLDELTPAQMVHYLLQYKRHGQDDDDVGTRDKNKMHVLEIEPCSEFTMSERFLTGKYLPASKFKGEIEVDHMTTAEFNGLKRDLNGYYDLIYIGDNIGKFNTKKKTVSGKEKTIVKRNSSLLEGYVYLHVGDKAGDLHSSGNDITEIKKKELKAFAEGGNALILADTLATFKWNSSGDITKDYEENYLTAVDQSSQMHKLLTSVKSPNKGVTEFQYANVTSLSQLSSKFLSKNCLSYMNKGFSFPTRVKTGLTSKKYKEMTTAYKDYVGLYSKIVSTPVQYYSDAGVSDEDKNASGTTAPLQSLAGSTLDFSFMIGDQSDDNKYGLRLYIDLNGDGIISKDELVEDTYANDSGVVYTYRGEDTKDSSGKPYTNKAGETIQVPAVQNYSYDFSNNSRLYLNKNKKSGAISWKFVLYNTSNKENYQSVTGVSRYERPNLAKAQSEIKVLQVVADAQMSTQANLENELSNSGSLFAKYATDKDIMKDFAITVTTISLTDFVAQVKAGTLGNATTGDEYNCYVISCGSELTGSSDADYVAADNYLTNKATKDGVTVVFTGEALTSDYKAENLKNVLNMCRFTAKDPYYGSIKDAASRPFDDKAYPGDKDKFEYSYAKVMEDGSGENKVYNNDLWKNLDYGDKAKKDTNANRNNKGRITTYPYTIDQSLKIASTAAQDYQLNMENSGLVVWYSLGAAGEGDDSEYGISPRDASNNYYLYTVQNVTYDLIDLENVSDDMEMKLFINTLSGTMASPNVVVDEGKSVNKDYKDLTINEVTSSYYDLKAGDTKKSSDGLDMTIYSGSLKPSGSKYKDYDANATAITPAPSAAATPVPSGGSTGGEDGEATPEPTKAPTPTPVPTKDPKIFLYNKEGKQWWQVMSENADDFKGWKDSDLLVIDYSYEPTNEGTNAITLVNKEYNKFKYLPGKTQTFSMTLGELKDFYGTTNDLSFLNVFSWDGNCKVYTVGIFENMQHFEDYKKSGGGTSGSGSDADYEPGEDIGEKESDDDLKPTYNTQPISFIPKNVTHRIWFTPYTNATDCLNVNSFKISLVMGSSADIGTKAESTISYIDKIYQETTDKDGNKELREYEASKDHTFTVKENNFLRDKVQYYFYAKDNFINNTADHTNAKTRWVRFDIANRRRSALTYLHLYYEGDLDTTYVFPLD